MPFHKRKCGAWCHGRERRCQRWRVRGKRRCKLHGGLYTGPRTPEGKAATFAALRAGHAALKARYKALGKRLGGKRKGRLDRRQMRQVLGDGSLDSILRLTERIKREQELQDAENQTTTDVKEPDND
jgi:hypothetical protein